MEKEKNTQLANQIKLIQGLSDNDLKSRLSDYRTSSLPQLTPYLIERWFNTNNDSLRSNLYQYFLDTQKQDELEYFITAIENQDYIEKRSELISVLWQSSLDASEYFGELINIAINGDYMTIIEVSTVIDSFDIGFEEQIILDTTYQIDESIEEESDEERSKLLRNLRQIISELYSI